MKSFFQLILICFSISLFGQNKLEPVKWSFDINQVGQTDYELFYMANIKKNWSIYSKDTDAGGPIPVSVTYTSKNVKLIGDSKESGLRKEGMDDLFEMNVIKYQSSKPYTLKQKVTVTDISIPVKGYVTYMACDNEKCLPPTDVDFSFTINVVNPLDRSNNKSIKIKNF